MNFPGATKDFQPGGAPVTWPNWVPWRTLAGLRVEVLGIIVKWVYNLTTDATGTLYGADLWRGAYQIQLTDIGGLRYALHGETLRKWTGLFIPRALQQHDDIAASTAGATGEVYIWLPFAKPWIYAPGDTRIGADEIVELSVACPTAAQLSDTAGVTFNAGNTLTPIAVCRANDTAELFTRDVIVERAMNGKQVALAMSNERVAEILATRIGSQGGAAVANWSYHTIDPLALRQLTVNDYHALYALERNMGRTPGAAGATPWGDLVASQLVVPVWIPDNPRAVDCPLVNGNCTIESDNTDADIVLLQRTLVQRPATVGAQVAQHFGVQSWHVKTAKGTKTSPAAWGKELSKILPAVAA